MKLARSAAARVTIELAPGPAAGTRADAILREIERHLSVYTGKPWQDSGATYGWTDRLTVHYGTFWNCGFCGQEWHEDYEGVPTCCAQARAEWVAQRLEGNQGP